MKKYPEYIMKILRQMRELDENDTSADNVLASYSPSEVLDEVCNWDGLVHCNTTILRWIKDIYGVDLNSNIFDSAVNDKMKTYIVNGYKETVYAEVEISDAKSIMVCTSERDDSILADIRQFSLYKKGNVADNKKKATDKGIKFRVENIPKIMIGLAKIYSRVTGMPVGEVMRQISESAKDC